ncbi:MAG: hypothetical protein ACI4SF_15565 [Oscillospiraceae bacterium]
MLEQLEHSFFAQKFVKIEIAVIKRIIFVSFNAKCFIDTGFIKVV